MLGLSDRKSPCPMTTPEIPTGARALIAEMEPQPMTGKPKRHMSNYEAYMDAQERLRFYAYSLRVMSEELEAKIMSEDTSALVAHILESEAEVARLKLVRI